MVWFTEDDLRAAADAGSFRRGREYVDAVVDLQPTALGVRARVKGKNVYEVWLGRDNDTLVAECGCPFGLEGNFCKHCVAVGLALLADEQPAPASTSAPEADLGTYVRSLKHQELADLVLAQAERDPALYRQLVLRAGSKGAPQVAVLRRQLDEALRVRGFTDTDYARRATDVLDTINALVETGHAAEARPLARHAVELLADAMGAIEDDAGTVARVCRRAVKLYARACTAARPNPAKLATWLFHLRLAWTTWPTIDITDFAEPLGETGMTTYHTLVDEAWHNLADDEDPTVLRAMREHLAKTSGNVDALVEVLSDGLPAAKAYRGIVEALRHADRLNEAIRWAEQGVKETRDVALTELLVQSYIDAQRGDEAVELRKTALREAPTRLCYTRLRDTAITVRLWSGLRPWALNVLTAEPKELVGALLDDNEVTEAWHTAVKYDCIDIEVVRRRCETNPDEVLPAYRSLIKDRISQGTRDCYREAAILLRDYTTAATQCGEPTTDFITKLKEENQKKPALKDELKKAGF